MNIGLLTAIWGRPRLTDLVLRYYERLDLKKVLVYSEEDPCVHDLVTGDWGYIGYPNNNLSGKWNHGMMHIRSFHEFQNNSLAGVMIVGSDDLVTPQYVDAVKYLLARGVDYISLPTLYFYNLDTGRMHYCLAERLGLGRVLSRRLLDMLDWEPWPNDLNSGLDGAMWDRISKLKDVKAVKLSIKTCTKLGIAALDIKGGGNNIWSYQDSVSNLIGSEIKKPAEVLNKHFPNVAQTLLNWND